MRKVLTVFAVLFVVFAGVSVKDGHAAFYKYVDKNGIVCIADNLQFVPEQYRDKVVIVQNESELHEERPAGAQTAAIKEEYQAADVRAPAQAKRPFSTRLLITAVVVIGFIAVLIALKNIRVPEKQQKLISPARITLISLLSVYLIVAHAKDVIRIFSLAGGKIEEIEARQAEKGKKAGQAIKTLNSLLDGNLQKADQEQQK